MQRKSVVKNDEQTNKFVSPMKIISLLNNKIAVCIRETNNTRIRSLIFSIECIQSAIFLQRER